MPIMSGFEATRAIRKMEEEGALNRTPILALTANVSTESSFECTKAGMGQSDIGQAYSRLNVSPQTTS